MYGSSKSKTSQVGILLSLCVEYSLKIVDRGGGARLGLAGDTWCSIFDRETEKLHEDYDNNRTAGHQHNYEKG